MFNLEVLAFVLYFIAMMSIGVVFFFRSKNASEKEYFLGGRSMGPWVTALSAQASDMSAWLLMGLPGSIMAFGLGQVWIGIGLALGTIANWIFVAKPLRRFSKAANDSITLPQYLTNRFASQSHALQIICAVIFLVCFTIYVASAFVAGATVFVTVFPTLQYSTAMLVFALIIIVYTFLGGYKAVCWTDFFQGMLMLVALLAVPIVVVLTKELDAAALNNVYVNAADGTEYVFGQSLFGASATDILSGLAWGLGYFGMPHIIVRFMGIQKPSQVKTASTGAIVWVVLSLGSAIAFAILGRTFLLKDGTALAALLLPAGNQQNIFIVLAQEIFPPLVAGLLLAAIVAAAMSTADSQLLASASAFANDVYKPVLRKNAGNREMLWASRLVVVAIAVVALLIASNPNSGTIMGLVENAWGVFGAAFGPVILLSLYWKRLTFSGAVAGIATGALVDILWLVLLSGTGIYEIIPGFFAGLIASLVVSLCSPVPGRDVEELFDRAAQPEI